MNKCYLLFSFFTLFYAGCAPQQGEVSNATESPRKNLVRLMVLGTLQDGGAPHIGCEKRCCKNLITKPDPQKKVVSLGLIDAQNKTYLFEASPDLSTQLSLLNKAAQLPINTLPSAIFLTHAHIGHYAGLMYLGKEAMGAKNVNVYTLPRMYYFLNNNGPWSQLCQQKNVVLDTLIENREHDFGVDVKVTAMRVPHRDEYSETVGFLISGPHKKVLFIPDIDKWQKWHLKIVDEIKKVDFAFIDATFYDAQEINHRAISEIPHPFVVESMQVFKNLSAQEKSKIHFIHLNHTNPLLDTNSWQYQTLITKGFHVAQYGQIFEL